MDGILSFSSQVSRQWSEYVSKRRPNERSTVEGQFQRERIATRWRLWFMLSRIVLAGESRDRTIRLHSTTG